MVRSSSPLRSPLARTGSPLLSKSRVGLRFGDLAALGRSGTTADFAGALAANGGVRIPTEERGITVKQLKRLAAIIESNCVEQGWKDPFEYFGEHIPANRNPQFNRPLQPELVNLFHVNYYVICPETVPEGVTLLGLQERSYSAGTPIVQKLTGARGEIMENCEGSEVRVRVFQGKFERPSWSNTFGDISAGWFSCAPAPPHEVAVVADVHCSFVELFAKKPQKPQWFVSHWWGEPVLDFVKCVVHHADIRGMTENAAYWVCAYANDQHELEVALSENPRESSFYRALMGEQCQGVLLLLNDSIGNIKPAMPFSRIWCVFEVATALQNSSSLALDIATCHGPKAELLTDGLSKEETEKAKQHASWAAEAKMQRERTFPITVVNEGLEVTLQHANASVLSDKKRILNTLVGQQLEADPPDSHRTFDEVNAKLRGRFAVSAWPVALSQDKVEEMRLPKVLHEDSFRKDLSMFFGWRKEFNDEQLGMVARGFPDGLTRLDLNISGCANVGDAGIGLLGKAISRLESLKTLVLEISYCPKIQHESLDQLGKHLGGLCALEELTLKFIDCKKLTMRSVVALAARLGGSLSLGQIKHVDLDFSGTKVDDKHHRIQSTAQLCELLKPEVAPRVRTSFPGSPSRRTSRDGFEFLAPPPQPKEFKVQLERSGKTWLATGDGDNEWLYNTDEQVYVHTPSQTAWLRKGGALKAVGGEQEGEQVMWDPSVAAG